MKVFLEYIPLILFLLLYKMEPRQLSLGDMELSLGGIYSATAWLMASTVLVYGLQLLKEKRLSRMQWIVVAAVLLFGSSTLLLRSEDILKWKAPVVNWIIALIFLGSQFVGRQNMAQSMFGQMVDMPAERWTRLNLGWVFTFLLVGTANLVVAFRFHEYWVDFKVFGSFGILLLATVAQIAYLYPYLAREEDAAAAASADAAAEKDAD
jgi:intracellular septation protein